MLPTYWCLSVMHPVEPLLPMRGYANCASLILILLPCSVRRGTLIQAQGRGRVGASK